MRFSQFLIKLAVDKYNLEYKKTFDPVNFLIKKITPNIRTDMGCEIYTIREDDFLRLRIYLVFSDITQLIPYKLEVDRSSSINDYTDEVHVTTGDIDFFYIRDNFDLSECGVVTEEPEIPVVIPDKLIREKLGYILTEAGDMILIPTIYPYSDKHMIKINYCRNSFNGHLNVPVNDHYEFTESMAVSSDFDRIAVSSAFGRITNIPLASQCMKNTTGEIIIYKKQSNNTWMKETTLYGFNNGDTFGLNLDMNANGDILTVAACGTTKVFTYIRSGSNWSLLNVIDNTDNETDIISVRTPVCVSNVSVNNTGNIILTNGSLKDLFVETALDIGSISVYNRVGSVFNFNSSIDISSLSGYGLFGYKFLISKSGNRIIATTAKDLNASTNIIIPGTSEYTADPNSYTGPIVDLTQFKNIGYNFSFGPVVIPNGITITAFPEGGGNTGQGSIFGQGTYSLEENGAIGDDAVYVALDSANGYIDLTFTTPVTEFGAFFNYGISGSDIIGTPPYIAAINQGIEVARINLHTEDPIITPNGFNEFRFRGIDTSSILVEGGESGTPDTVAFIETFPTTGFVDHGDDNSSLLVSLGFSINFYGNNTTGIYVNNNGNITFISSISAYTPSALSSLAFPILAPFWADTDTSSPSSGVVYYGESIRRGKKVFIITWDNVGYYRADHNGVDKLNKFQIVLIDRSDVNPGDFDIEYNYTSIQWETGDASGAGDGLGGISAFVGWTSGTISEQLPGSGINGTLINGGANALISNHLTPAEYTPLNGRYIWQVRGGIVVNDFVPIPVIQTFDTFRFGGSYMVMAEACIPIVSIVNRDTIYNNGDAYIFSKIGATWTLEDTVRGLDSTIFDSSNKHISINEDGTVIVIGASTATIGGVQKAGAVYIFVRSETSWTQTVKIVNPDIVNIIQFGNSVKISGDGNVLYISALMKSVYFSPSDKYKCYWYGFSYRKIEGVWTLESQFHDETKFNLYTSIYYNTNKDRLSEEILIDTNYDGSKVAIGSDNFLYIFE